MHLVDLVPSLCVCVCMCMCVHLLSHVVVVVVAVVVRVNVIDQIRLPHRSRLEENGWPPPHLLQCCVSFPLDTYTWLNELEEEGTHHAGLV